MRGRFDVPSPGSAEDREAAAVASRSLREAELLRELGATGNGQEQTYRLLVGVLLRDPGELEGLRAETVSPLMAYDSRHGTELVATLREFLVHD